MDKEQEAFEAWAQNSRSVGFIERNPDDWWHIPDRGQYKVLNAKVAWEAWQAAKEHAKKPELPCALCHCGKPCYRTTEGVLLDECPDCFPF